MKKLAWFGLLILALGCNNSSELSGAESERELFSGLKLTDINGSTVYAELEKTDRVAHGVILMFHQAGSNMHEYDPIAETVAKYGWDCLKVDQRSGGEMWGEINLTNSQFDQFQTFLFAYQDMETALQWAEEEDYDKIVVWGSSYSASLVLKLASENDSIDAVMSFSPGEYKRLYPGGEKPADGSLVASWNADVNVPVYFASTGDEREELYSIKDTAADTPERYRDVVQTSGKSAHGSSTLREDKNPDGYEWYWQSVKQFLVDISTDGRAFGG